jgi:hypothetical protein
LQQRYGMADEQMLGFHKRAAEWLSRAQAEWRDANPADAVNSACVSMAYALHNHPVIRRRIAHAVIGILWYLALLVPFTFFAEKLIFGFTDIRKQLLAVAGIFGVCFALLRTFHPAFQMVRSSLMILLGFVILLLTLLVTMMVGGKFRQNIKDLRRKEGAVEGADINRGGVVGTAFMLGLNNMRRRKVRTGLTCVTLVLITFVMICFTSVSTDLLSVEYATGRSAWNGIYIRDANYQTLDENQLDLVRRLYGARYPIAVTKWLTSMMGSDQGGRVRNPDVAVDREFTVAGSRVSKRVTLNAAIQMEWNEPEFSGIDKHLLTHRGWFPRPPATRAEILAAAKEGRRTPNYVILPDAAARELGLTVEDVDNGHPTVTIRGQEYEVFGIIDSVALGRTVGPDGSSIMPYDLNSVQQLGMKGERQIVPEDIGHLAASQVLIANRLPQAKGSEQSINATCAVRFPAQEYRLRADEPFCPAVPYKEQRRVVQEHLERTGQPSWYAIDGVSYYGYSRRAKTLAGMLQLLVPIVLAAFTVFNTMRGSVYERKGEIYVYNAVGIAPNHVFFMFMAEACVYAVVGAMCGYILSQGTGRLMTALGLTGGLNMDYSSIETIYASLTIMLAVLLSTILPARDAARLASPSGVASWTVPRIDGDSMEFDLPFTFTAHDRVAVVSYFHRWLEANGAGSSGPFYSSAPEARLLTEGGLTPALASTVWLKPYDLGVSQSLLIALPRDAATGDFIAHVRLERLSGNLSAWERTVRPFLSSLRKQFLNWRATTTDDRGEMFAEAKQLLSAAAEREL